MVRWLKSFGISITLITALPSAAQEDKKVESAAGIAQPLSGEQKPTEPVANVKDVDQAGAPQSSEQTEQMEDVQASLEQQTQDVPPSEEIVTDQSTQEESVVEQQPEPAVSTNGTSGVDQAMEQAPVIQPPLGPDEVMGIDTVDLDDPQGNWLYKRVWWERAEAKYEKIRNAVNKILEMRTGFFAQRAELDKTVLDPFYIKIGLSQGELQEILSELIARASKDTKDKTDAQILEQAEVDKQELEQLQKQVQQVIKHDEEVENAILMLVEQINRIRALEQEAWQNFKNIARVLDDKKARELFYKVDNAWRNIQELHRYVEQTYSGSFDQLIDRIKDQIRRIDNSVLILKEKGIDLKKRVLSDQEEKEEESIEQSKGIITRYIVDPIKYVFQSLWSLIRWPIDKIFGTKSGTQESEDDEKEAEPSSSETAQTEEQSTQESIQPPQEALTTQEQGISDNFEEEPEEMKDIEQEEE